MAEDGGVSPKPGAPQSEAGRSGASRPSHAGAAAGARTTSAGPRPGAGLGAGSGGSPGGGTGGSGSGGGGSFSVGAPKDPPPRPEPRRLPGFIRWIMSAGFPMLIFLGLSWTSTTLGLVGLISADRGEATITEYAIVGLLVLAATITMKLMLDVLIASRGLFRGGLSLFGYVTLMLLSVGFGFAFYWELLEARRQSFDDARGAVSSASETLEESRAILVQLSTSLDALAADSADKAQIEETVGFTCEANIGPGPGPRREFRRAEAVRFAQAATLVGARIEDQETQINALSERLVALESAAEQGVEGNEARDAAFAAINADFDRFEADFNAFLTVGPLPDLAQTFAADAAAYRDPTFVRSGPGSGGAVSEFVCTDAALARRLEQLSASINGLQPVSFGGVRVIEGAGATTEAFERLTISAGDLVFFWRDRERGEADATRERVELERARRAAMADGDQEEARRLATEILEATGGVNGPTREGLQSRDMIPLFTAGIVDLMILVLTLLQGPDRGGRFGAIHGGMERASRSPLSPMEFLSYSRELAGDPNFRLFEAYRFSYLSKDYVAVPVSPSDDPAEAQDDVAISNLLRALKAKGFARRAHPVLWGADRVVAMQLAARRSPAAGREGYELWRLDGSFWAEALDGFYDDARRVQKARRGDGPAEPAASKRAKREKA